MRKTTVFHQVRIFDGELVLLALQIPILYTPTIGEIYAVYECVSQMGRTRSNSL